MRAAPSRYLRAWLLPVLLVLALVAASAVGGALLPADPAQAQEETDTTRPEITVGPVITSDPTSGDTYGKGETIVVTVTFSEAVTVEGNPRVRLDMGDRTRWARYNRTEKDGTILVFAYTVKGNDLDKDGVSIRANQLGLNRGSIADDDDNAANLEHPALTDQADHKVDGLQEADPSEEEQKLPANNEPRFTEDGTERSVDEDAAVGGNVGVAVTAIDADGDALTYALSGSDAFAVGESSGQITVRATLDYETKAEYTVTVTVHDGKNASGGADSSVDNSIEVIIAVNNVDEAGTVAFDLNQPQADSALTATLTDPDDDVTGLAWAWKRSADRGAWEAIDGATQASYTPSSSDVGNYLQATASYTDGHGPSKTASGATAKPVVALVDYDLDNDGLISITTQEQLAAVTLDLDGDGAPDDEKLAGSYQEAFPNAVAGMGCPESTGCIGYELDENLTLTGSWSAIGANDDGGASSFTGTFDGNGNTVSGLSIPSGDDRYTALFAWLGLDGVIRNIGVVAPNIHNSADGPWVYAAGLVGNNQGVVIGSYVKGGTVTSSGKASRVGGLAGQSSGTIKSSRASANVSASGKWSEVGGLAGTNVANDGGTIRNSRASGNVSASGYSSSVGGLVGDNDRTIRNSRSSGNVSASGYSSYVGGLAGSNDSAIIDSRASGNVRARGDGHMVGGLAGDNEGAIRGSYASGSVIAWCDHSEVGGLVGDNAAPIKNSYASGNVRVKGDSNGVGGLAGNNRDFIVRGAIVNSYASGKVTASGGNHNFVGGLLARNHGKATAVSNSYWDKEAAGVASSSGSPESAGKTTAEMKTATGPSSRIYTGWDTKIWDFSDPASYPTLR